MKHYGLIGEKLGHSLSVPIHEAVFRMLGLEVDYRLIEIPGAETASRIPALLAALDGFNVTIPYKRTVMPYLRSLDGFAASIGAVNTVLCADASGHNTDAPGFAAMLRAGGLDPAGKPCFVLGTGGAALAVKAALKRTGAASVTLVSRRPSPERADEIGYDALPEMFSGLLVNTTPVGMHPNADACPLTDAALAIMLPKACGVADVIYNPRETLLTAAARRAGVPACTGLTMLAAQAVEAERIWQGDAVLPASQTAELTAAVLREVFGAD